jgi:hypothetical protein
VGGRLALVNTVENLIERALRGPRSELREVQREIVRLVADPTTTDEDKVRLMWAGECVAMSLMTGPDSP